MGHAGTCAEACWQAREPICRCACDGANHGCMVSNGRPTEGRTKRTGEQRWRLYAVVDHWTYMDRNRYLGDAWAWQVIPKACKWPEAQGADDWALFLWVKTEIAPAAADASFTVAGQMAELQSRHYHNQDCDGALQYKGAKRERPCESPAYHQPNATLAQLYATLRCRPCQEGDCDWHHSNGLCSCPNPHKRCYDDPVLPFTDHQITEREREAFIQPH